MKRDENQNVEYKESWHDKYLEWICGRCSWGRRGACAGGCEMLYFAAWKNV